ncbi:MAG: hypothetical protein AWU59_2362 [Methanolobus sp. T82-4]|jgi:hypothetical protein|nr:MAG: hypothetical protein AWU59_2362 [Methanolobus sp. T82-4]
MTTTSNYTIKNSHVIVFADIQSIMKSERTKVSAYSWMIWSDIINIIKINNYLISLRRSKNQLPTP